ncbi:uncharacterized protein LOC132926691 [Rhopalosiphum padi]|uniref:uncharacterized protein LOC132926691 n=1 Tax=Rhopalosiphum padi TaxID=40932 RepID=UPI00298D65E5|nr:uncharacterized protein LOC132926691 [Rhopalosiphum padi]
MVEPTGVSVSETPEPMDMDEPQPSPGVIANAVRGRNVARRGRNRPQTSNDDRTPFNVGMTFNGFARHLEPDAVTGHLVENGTILYQVRWSENSASRPIESSLMRSYRPLMLLDFYEEMIKNNGH